MEIKTLLSILSIVLGLLGNQNVIGPRQALPTNDRDLAPATVEAFGAGPPGRARRRDVRLLVLGS